MPKTRKTIQLKYLATYDVLIEDTSSTSTYFQVANLPRMFTGGRNSFLIAGSSLLAPGSTIEIEILDANGNSIYQNPVKNYVEGTARLVTVEINEATAPGFATIILLGRASIQENGDEIPPDWQNSYNVRWSTQILVEPRARNTSPLIFETTPRAFTEEKRLYSVNTSSYTTTSSLFTASLTQIPYYSTIQDGYLIKAVSASFSSSYLGGYITGSLLINDISASLSLPITDILNDTTALSTGYLIQTVDGRTVDKLYLYSGSYQTQVFGATENVTSSANIEYSILETENIHIPMSYAKIRLVNLNTVSGEIYKFKVYSKVSTNLSEYKLIANVATTTTELLVTSSIRGELPIGDFNISPIAAASWYADKLETGSNTLYDISGSSAYYDSSITITPFTISVTDDVLLRSIRAEVPIYNDSGYDGYLSASGYFIGSINPVQLFSTTEYTFQLDAMYKQTSGSANLMGVTPKVDIYLIGVNGSSIINNNPLGQKIGTLEGNTTGVQRYQAQQFNFNPQLADSGYVGVRFVITNGFWYFSNISLKPASDKLFSPDEVTFVVPNTEHHNEYLQHKIEFFDINNNSTDVSIVSIPTFFTGSNIDLGIIP